MSMKQDEQVTPEFLARRRLLAASVYVPPAVMGVMVAGSTPAQAAVVGGVTIPISATSNACGPCANVIAVVPPALPNPADIIKCLEKQCKNTCVNCGIFVGNPQLWPGKTTCDKCTEVIKNGCTLPVACSVCTCTNKNANKPNKKPKWKCV
jgi:hypothetical protein